jgi:hypothetical protein
MLSAPSMFNAPSPASPATPDSDYIQPTLNHGLRIWWAYYWPTSVAAGLLTILLAYCVRVLYQRVMISASIARPVLLSLPYATTAGVGLLIFRYLLGKRFRHFRLALRAKGEDTAAVLLIPRWRRTVRVWWTFTWRTILYGVVLSFLVNISLGIMLGMLMETSRLMAALVPVVQGLIIAAAVGLFVIYSNVLDEEFGDFRVVLLPRETTDLPSPASVLPAASQPTV